LQKNKPQVAWSDNGRFLRLRISGENVHYDMPGDIPLRQWMHFGIKFDLTWNFFPNLDVLFLFSSSHWCQR